MPTFTHRCDGCVRTRVVTTLLRDRGDSIPDDALLPVEADGASSHEDGDQEGLNPSSEDDGAGFGPVVALLAILGGGMAARPRT